MPSVEHSRLADEPFNPDIIGLLKKDIGPLRRLTQPEEVALGILVRRGQQARQELISGGSRVDQGQAKGVISAGQVAMEQLVLANVPFVIRTARRYKITHQTEVPWQDLFQEGMIGLMRGVQRYDPVLAAREGTKLLSFAGIHVRRCIRWAARKSEFAYLGEDKRDAAYFYYYTCKRLQAEYGPDYSDELVAAKLGWNPEKLTEAQKVLDVLVVASLDQPVRGREGVTLGEWLPSGFSQETYFQGVFSAAVSELAEELLDPRQERVMRLLLEGFEIVEIAQKMGLSDVRVRQIFASGVDRLYNPKVHALLKGTNVGESGFKRTKKLPKAKAGRTISRLIHG